MNDIRKTQREGAKNIFFEVMKNPGLRLPLRLRVFALGCHK